MKRYLELIWYKACAEMKVDAERAYLGYLWWVAEPLIYMVAFYFIFDVGIRRGGLSMVPFLLSGLVPWKWFASCVKAGSNAIRSNNGLLQQVYLPKYIFPGIVLVANTLKFGIILGLLLVLLILFGHYPTWTWLMLPVLIFVQFVMMLAIASFLSALVPIFPDIKLLIDNAIIIGMFTAGVFFDIAKRSPDAQLYLRLNPMTEMIESYRQVLLHNELPAWRHLAIILFASLLLYCLTLQLLRKYDQAYPKILAT